MTTTLAQSSITNFVVSQAGTIADLASELTLYYQNMGYGITNDDVIQAITSSYRLYAGWALTNGQSISPQPITRATQITVDEWAIVHALIGANVDFVQANRVEATKALGTEAFGLTSSEARQNITIAEENLKKEAFIEPPFTVDYEYDTTITRIKRL